MCVDLHGETPMAIRNHRYHRGVHAHPPSGRPWSDRLHYPAPGCIGAAGTGAPQRAMAAYSWNVWLETKSPAVVIIQRHRAEEDEGVFPRQVLDFATRSRRTKHVVDL